MEKYLITKNVNIIKQNLLNKLLLAGYKIICSSIAKSIFMTIVNVWQIIAV